jgi:hypothetical protein
MELPFPISVSRDFCTHQIEVVYFNQFETLNTLYLSL